MLIELKYMPKKTSFIIIMPYSLLMWIYLHHLTYIPLPNQNQLCFIKKTQKFERWWLIDYRIYPKIIKKDGFSRKRGDIACTYVKGHRQIFAASIFTQKSYQFIYDWKIDWLIDWLTITFTKSVKKPLILYKTTARACSKTCNLALFI